MDNALIMRMANEAGAASTFRNFQGCVVVDLDGIDQNRFVEKFAALVAEHAAQIADANYAEAANRECVTHEPILRGQMSAAKAIGETIRAKFKEPT